ncbi:hypothetical protein KY359_04310 [Candidatus Woesearchaeota archaeon]|nr:hypothetical protein [Candidatus Woesearchaeota archaeon]
MGVERFIRAAEDLGLSEIETARFLVERGWSCMRAAVLPGITRDERIIHYSDALECRIVSAFIFEDLGMKRDRARSLDRAGESAFGCNARRLNADLKTVASRIYVAEGLYRAGGYSLLNAAEALLSKGNRHKYFEQIGDLVNGGVMLLEQCDSEFDLHYVEKVVRMYEGLRRSVEERQSAAGPETLNL